jgi:hypothetical protein
MEHPRIERFDRDGLAMIAMPLEDWQAIEESLEEEALRRAAEEWLHQPREPGIPIEFFRSFLQGVHPLKVYRERRGLSQSELTAKAGVLQPAIA